VSDAQGGEGALKLRTRIAVVGGGNMAEKVKAVGVNSQWQVMFGEELAKMFKVVPGGVGGDKSCAHEFSGMVVHREQKRLFVFGQPPLVNGGVMLPELVDAGALPAAAWFGVARGRPGQVGKL
jgi:hypothetical protein